MCHREMDPTRGLRVEHAEPTRYESWKGTHQMDAEANAERERRTVLFALAVHQGQRLDFTAPWHCDLTADELLDQAEAEGVSLAFIAELRQWIEEQRSKQRHPSDVRGWRGKNTSAA